MAMYNELVLENLASHLGFNDLKSCRAVNFLWKDIMTPYLMKKEIGPLQLNETSISAIVNLSPEEQFLWDSVDLDWGFGHSKPDSTHYNFGQFFLKFGVHIKQLHWIGADLSHKDHKMCGKSSEVSTVEMGGGMMKFDPEMGRQLGEFLYLMPNLEVLTIGWSWSDAPYYGPLRYKQCNPVTDTLCHLNKLGVTNLTTLNLSTRTSLNMENMSLLKDLGLKMKNFTWLGRQIKWQSGLQMADLINSWSSTLEKLHFMYSPDFKLGPMPVLKSFRVELMFKLLNPLPFVEQFPVLEEMNWNFDRHFNWDLFIPAQMPPHVHLQTLNLMRTHCHNIPVPSYVRFIQKCPKIKSLTTNVLNEDVAKAIFQNLLDLEHLDTHPGLSLPTFRGVEDPFNDETSDQDVLNPNILCIRKLTKLRHVKIRGPIDDACVWFGIALLKNLEKLELPRGISDITLDRFMTQAPKLRELTLTLSQMEHPDIWISEEGVDSLLAARPGLRIYIVEETLRGINYRNSNFLLLASME